MLAHEYDELADDDPQLLTSEPMKPIRLPYTSHPGERNVQREALEALGLEHVLIGQNLYALNEQDSQRLTLDAREKLAAGGVAEPTGYQVTRMTEAMLTELVLRERAAKSVNPVLVAQLLRAEQDVLVAARGAALKANIAAAVAEFEAA